MKRLFNFVAAGFFAATLVFASNAFAEASWQKLFDLALHSKDEMQVNDGSFYNTLTLVNGQEGPIDTSRGRKVEYFSTVSFLDSFGAKRPVYVDVVSEEWTERSADVFAVDQWLYRISLDGESIRFGHHTYLVEKKDGLVLDSGFHKETDATINAKWLSLKKMWLNLAERK